MTWPSTSSTLNERTPSHLPAPFASLHNSSRYHASESRTHFAAASIRIASLPSSLFHPTRANRFLGGPGAAFGYFSFDTLHHTALTWFLCIQSLQIQLLAFLRRGLVCRFSGLGGDTYRIKIFFRMKSFRCCGREVCSRVSYSLSVEKDRNNSSMSMMRARDIRRTTLI